MLKDTIISAFNYDGTLLKWLKKVEDALQNASASEFRVNKKGNATISFSIVFANGDTLESGDIILQQGESVTNATIRQGHLILTLSNGDELDAGNMFNGNVVINGAVSTPILTSQNDHIEAQKPVIEVMNDYSFTKSTVAGVSLNYVYAGIVKNGNKLTYVLSLEIAKNEATTSVNIGTFNIPSSIGEKLFPSFSSSLFYGTFSAFSGGGDKKECVNITYKSSDNERLTERLNLENLPIGTTYYVRIEKTFLLSDNLAE